MGLSDWLRGSSLSKKICLVLGGGALLSCSAYGLYKILYLQQTEQDPEETADANERRILILGLDGSGKSTFLSVLSQQGHDNAKRQDEKGPTKGFNVMCVSTNGLSLNIWEIGGAENFRIYWPNFIEPSTDVLIYAIDSTDQERFEESKEALGEILRDSNLKGVPLILLATKTDLPEASTIEQLSVVFDIATLSSTRKVLILGTEVPPNGPEKGIGKAQQALLEMCEH